MLNRRHAILAAGAALALAPRAARSQGQPVPFRISTAAAEGDWLARALRQFKADLDRDLPGQFNVTVAANASLFRQGTEVPALQRGNLEMSTMTTFEVEGQLPEWGALSAGYAFRDLAHLRAVFRGPIGDELKAAVAEKMGIQILDTLYLGTRQMNLVQPREVRAPADLAGVKLRMPPGPGWLALGRGLGVTPVAMGIPEVYLALKSGAIDGQENPLSITRINNFQEVTRQVVMTSHLVQPVFLAVAKPFWDRMGEAQKAAVTRAARAAVEFNDSGRTGEEATLLAEFEAAGSRVARPDLAPFRTAVAAQYEADGLARRWAPGLAQRIAEAR